MLVALKYLEFRHIENSALSYLFDQTPPFLEYFSILPDLYGIISFNVYRKTWMNVPAVHVRTEGLAVTSSTDTTVSADQDSADLTARQIKVSTF